MVNDPLESPSQLTVLYDGACPLCRREIGVYQAAKPDTTVCFADVNDLAQALPPGTSRAQLLAQFHVRRGDGQLLRGAEAFLALWAVLPGWRWLARLGRLPGATALLERIYRIFLHWRPTLQRWAAHLDPPLTPQAHVRESTRMNSNESGPSSWALGLGIGGLAPFVALAAMLWVGQPENATQFSAALLGFGAVIASFLGAIHWGLTMRDHPSPSLLSLIWGVVPGLIGWAALLVNGPLGLTILAAALAVCCAMDCVLYPRHQMRSWLPMRVGLTLVAGISCLAGAAALLR